jgi:hypothetical protein
MAATGADKATAVAWLERRSAPAGEQAARLSELVAHARRLEVPTKPQVIRDWLNRSVPMLDGRTPLSTRAAGEYKLVAAIAEDLIDPRSPEPMSLDIARVPVSGTWCDTCLPAEKR